MDGSRFSFPWTVSRQQRPFEPLKTLLLLRHAKSDWDATYGDDHARPLAERGVKAARKMGRWATSVDLVPDRALASTALRARQTLALAAEAGGWAGPAHLTGALYEASPEAVLDEIRQTPDDAAVLVVVGHEPTTSRLVSLLIGGGAIDVRTATVARIDLTVTRWADAAPGAGVLSALLSPSSFRPGAYRRLRKDKPLRGKE